MNKEKAEYAYEEWLAYQHDPWIEGKKWVEDLDILHNFTNAMHGIVFMHTEEEAQNFMWRLQHDAEAAYNAKHARPWWKFW